MNNNALPDISVTLDDGRDFATALANRELGDDDFGLHYIGLSGTDVTDQVDGLSVDGELQVRPRGVHLAAVRGRGAPRRSKQRDTVENDTNGGSCIYCNLYDVDVREPRRPGRALPLRCRTSCATAAEATRTGSSASTSRPTSPRSPRSTASRSSTRTATRPGDVYDSSLVAPEFNPVQSYDVDEDTIAAYVSANFGTDNWFANAGLRWIDTETTARTAVDTHRPGRRPDAGRADLEPGRHLQPGRAVHGEGQLQQAAAVR